MEAYKELNKGLPDPFPPGQVRGDPGYTTREKLKRLQEGRMSEEGRLVFQDMIALRNGLKPLVSCHYRVYGQLNGEPITSRLARQGQSTAD